MGEPTEEEAVARLDEIANDYATEATSLRRDADALAGLPDQVNVCITEAESYEADALAIRTLLNSLAKHKEALEPFAAFYTKYADFMPASDDHRPVTWSQGQDQLRELKVRHFRRASNPGEA